MHSISKTALIGYTGFVGSTIASQYTFDDLYRSNNIETIRGKSYELVVCAAAPGAKWIANSNPGKDKDTIQRLTDNLHHLSAKTFLLVSTVDVYPSPIEVDEDSTIQEKNLSPYGLHRLMLEHFIEDTFDTALVVRLPALFGIGLKKNFVYDLVNNNLSSPVHPGSTFQFYNMTKLWNDLAILLKNKVRKVNLAVEPLSVSEIVSGVSYNPQILDSKKPIVRYDVHTKHAGIFAKSGVYLYTKSETLHALAAFITNERKKRQT